MKIEIEEYDPDWPIQFQQIAKNLKVILEDSNPRIEHVGSTSVLGLAAKPIIDILVGIEKISLLDSTIEPMINHNYIYYEIYNSVMLFRRFYVGLKEETSINKFQPIYSKGENIPHDEIHEHKLTHIHICEFGSFEYQRHIAFRDYLREHPTITTHYEHLKKELSLRNWRDGNDYNDGKDVFIKCEEAKAILWYEEKIKQRLTKDKMN